MDAHALAVVLAPNIFPDPAISSDGKLLGDPLADKRIAEQLIKLDPIILERSSTPESDQNNDLE